MSLKCCYLILIIQYNITHLHTGKWYQVLLSITNDSIRHLSFVYTYANNTKAQIDYVLINKKWKNSAMNCEAYSSFEGVSTDHRIVTAKIRLSLRKNAKRTATTKHYDWALLNNRDIRDKYVLELRNRFETLQEKTEKVHQTTNMKISSMHTSRQQRNAFQQNSKLNIESHGKL